MKGRVSKLAAVALALGFLGVSLSAGAAAVVLGIISLRHIRRSGGTLGGTGIAASGIVLAVLVPLFVIYIEMHRSFATVMVCGANLTRIGRAMQVYAEDHNSRLPTPTKWCDILLNSTDLKPEMLQCGPFRKLTKMHKCPLERYLYARWQRSRYLKAGACDYAMNPYAVERGTAGDPNTVLIFESGPGWNQAAGPEVITADHHDGRGCNVLFLDGHAIFVHMQEFAQLRWKP